MPDSRSTRWTIIRAAAGGDASARDAFARGYGSVVRAYLGARWRDSPLVRELDDASQEVFLACFREEGALTRVDPARPGGFRAFFFGVVRNVARRFEDQWTRRARQPDSRLDLAQIEGLRFVPKSPFSHDGLGNALQAAGNYGEALVELNRALEMRRGWSMALVARATAWGRSRAAAGGGARPPGGRETEPPDEPRGVVQSREEVRKNAGYRWNLDLGRTEIERVIAGEGD